MKSFIPMSAPISRWKAPFISLFNKNSTVPPAKKISPSTTRSGHPAQIEGIDGIRAIAVMAVIIFHADLRHFLAGGFLGVDVFFAISGFLITTLIISELEKTQSISFLNFYFRRSRRLLPALFVVLFFCAIYTPWFAPDAIKGLQEDTLPALLYYSNFWQLMDGQSYFEKFGRPHALQHLWSLAIEEQFYLFWPPLVLLFFQFRRKISPAWVIGLLSLLAVAWMWFLADYYDIPYENKPERLYFGTDTHSLGLLLGAFLASLRQVGISRGWWGRFFLGVIGVAALGYLLAAFVLLDESASFLYRGGFASISLATCLLILSGAQRGSLTNTLLQLPVLCWMGKRSYSLYLWHWPVFVYLRPGEELSEDLLVAFLIRLSLTFLFADLSYRLVERPIREKGLRAFGSYSFAGYGLSLAVLTSGFIALYSAKIPDVPVQEVAAQTEQPSPPSSSAVVAQEEPPPVELAKDPTAFINKPDEKAAFDFTLTDTRITAIGDSVMLGAKPSLYRRLPITQLDAEVGRQGSDTLKIIKKLEESHALSETVLIHIGSNGYIYDQNLKQILQILQNKKQIVFINIHADRRWTEENNVLLSKYQKIHKNITLIDWNAAATNHPDYFVKDGVHLTGKGIAAYVELVRLAMDVPEGKEYKHSGPTVLRQAKSLADKGREGSEEPNREQTPAAKEERADKPEEAAASAEDRS